MARTSTILVTAVLGHPPEVVWRALTEPEALQHWFMRADFAPEVGRRYRFDSVPVKGWRGWVEGKVTEADPPVAASTARLAYTWRGMPEHTPSLVTYTLEPLKADSGEVVGTHIIAEHAGFDSSHGWFNGWFLRAILKNGWRRMFKVLLPPVLDAIAAGTLENVNTAND
ncbi:MAG: SRPBCC domain-containing protein [bacterium]